MLTAIVRRGAGLALPILLGTSLGACSTLPGFQADVGATSNTQLAAAPTPPADEIKGDLGFGKDHFSKAHYGLAELHFRRAVEATPGNAEAWLGLAASYDQLKRWDLADRAYAQALKITGPTPAFLNNRGYSYLLRGDIGRASQDLSTAAARDPENEQIQNNLRTLDGRARKRV
jgi:Flp pilus assembly protein TadD